MYICTCECVIHSIIIIYILCVQCTFEGVLCVEKVLHPVTMLHSRSNFVC